MPRLTAHHASWIIRLLGLLVFPAVFIFDRTLLTDAAAAVRDATPAYLAAATLLMLAASVVRAVRWRLLAEAAGVRYARFVDYLSIYYAGLFLGAAVPQVAASFAPVVLMREDGHSWRRASISILFDRLVESTMILLVGLAAALYLLPEHPRLSVIVLLVSFGGLAALVGVTLLLRFAPRLVGRIERGPLARLRALTDVLESPEAAHMLRAMRGSAVSLAALSALAVALQIGVVIFLAKAIGLNASVVFLAAAAAMVVLVVMLPISVAGLGSREGILVVLFTAAGEPKEAAIALGVLLFFVGLVARLPGVLGWLRRRSGAAATYAPDAPPPGLTQP